MNNQDYTPQLSEFGMPEPPKKKMKTSTLVTLIISGVLVFGLVLTGAILLFVNAVISGIKNGDAYQTAIVYIENHREIKVETGEIESFKMQSGSISTGFDGTGKAEFTIRVNGSSGSVRVTVKLEREFGENWEIISFSYRRIN